jgi:tetratricopeptide (TPR) repeat protein
LEERLAYVTAVKAIAANYRAGDMPSSALPFLKEAHTLAEDDIEVLDDLADACMEADDEDRALMYARKRYLLTPDDTDALVGYAMAVLHIGRPDQLLSLFDERWERIERMPGVAALLAQVYAELAWNLRRKDPARSREITDRLREWASDSPYFLYMEGSGRAAAGERATALECYERVVQETEGHTHQSALGMALYDDGFPELGFRMFQKMVECGCERSIEELFVVVSYLAKKGNPEDAARLCTYAVDECDLGLYEAAVSLWEADEPHLARAFSHPLAVGQDADEEDHFLHLLILNDCRNPAEAIAFAEQSMARFRGPGYEDYQGVLKDVVKQLRTRGRARLPRE